MHWQFTKHDKETTKDKNAHLDCFPFWNYLCVPIGTPEMSLENQDV